MKKTTRLELMLKGWRAYAFILWILMSSVVTLWWMILTTIEAIR